jgi:hypothetical protein
MFKLAAVVFCKNMSRNKPPKKSYVTLNREKKRTMRKGRAALVLEILCGNSENNQIALPQKD